MRLLKDYALYCIFFYLRLYIIASCLADKNFTIIFMYWPTSSPIQTKYFQVPLPIHPRMDYFFYPTDQQNSHSTYYLLPRPSNQLLVHYFGLRTISRAFYPGWLCIMPVSYRDSEFIFLISLSHPFSILANRNLLHLHIFITPLQKVTS